MPAVTFEECKTITDPRLRGRGAGKAALTAAEGVVAQAGPDAIPEGAESFFPISRSVELTRSMPPCPSEAGCRRKLVDRSGHNSRISGNKVN